MSLRNLLRAEQLDADFHCDGRRYDEKLARDAAQFAEAVRRVTERHSRGMVTSIDGQIVPMRRQNRLPLNPDRVV